jgi:hypothetical protein
MRFTGSHFRVLGAIAMHDRMSTSRGTGQGCWASNATLATKCGINYTNLSTVVTDLARWGYLIRESHPLNKRLRIYRVIYDTLPADKPSSDDQDNCAADTLPTGKVSADTSAQTVCPQKSEIKEDQGSSGVEYIPYKREDTALKCIRNSAETAPLLRGDGLRNGRRSNDGAFLAITERALKDGKATLDPITEKHLERIMDERQDGDVLYHQAERILSTYGANA